MEMVHIDNIREGMILSEEVLNEKGEVLLKKGNILTKNLIGKLKSIGILGVYVKGEEDDGSDNTLLPTLNTELKELEYRFSEVKDNEIMQELKATVIEYITEKRNADGTS
tara:strand:- start:23 stop:352 length:330 start_codon:yes stop_codon:yes gene_type:complete